ncbi:MAG: twin-arginine translocase subunit TatC [Elusimicrobia bacterium]|nr:twin-arginine translocase subunit TatC [Elusimicrobiota bacterium]
MEDSPKPLSDHLEELRFRLIKSLCAIGLGTLLSYYFFLDPLISVLAKPVGHFIFLKPMDAFFVRLKIALASGILIAIPVVLWQAWQFVVVALTPLEKKPLFWVLPVSYLLFLCGSAFAFWILVPAGVRFLLSYQSQILVAQISIDDYINFVGILCLVLGAIFQMPLVSFFLARLGILHPRQISGQRRIAVLVIYVLSAFLTPGPDPVTAFLLALPTYFLYETSILTAHLAQRKTI